ncbi:hypothetical protein [Brevundimonas sp.]|uniref:hypothetical protein n=1 Tax=Brevundimonas sp. TaxID=1871086 RepID=UPI003D6CB954
MSLRLLLPSICALAACLLGSCASLPAPALPTCDGASRRPANPYGSVLSPEPATPQPTAATAEAEAPPTGGCA